MDNIRHLKDTNKIIYRCEFLETFYKGIYSALTKILKENFNSIIQGIHHIHEIKKDIFLFNVEVTNDIQKVHSSKNLILNQNIKLARLERRKQILSYILKILKTKFVSYSAIIFYK